jgi:DNA ligase-1
MPDGFRPLLGWNKPFALEAVQYPCIVSFKLDGWRAWPFGPEFFSRNFKTIANRDLQRRFRDVLLAHPNYDGELIAGEPGDPQAYRRTDKILKTHHADASSIRWFVFDDFTVPYEPYHKRLERVQDDFPLVVKLDQHVCSSPSDVLDLEERALLAGYEGLCLRSPYGRYKHGRSTFREQYLLKLKRFCDGEAIVVGFNELHSNQNEATLNPMGLTERSHHKANQIPMGTLGSLTVQMDGVEFRVGTGFEQHDRDEIWRNRDTYLGRRCTIKYSPTVKDKPRQPRWKGWRNDL